MKVFSSFFSFLHKVTFVLHKVTNVFSGKTGKRWYVTIDFPIETYHRP